LSVGGSGIAWNYGFRFRSTWFWYQPTFDSQFEQISPGSCLLTKIIGEACDLPQMQTVDLGLGAEEYKERVANTGRTTLHVTITSSWKNKAKAVMRDRAARAVKSWPALETQIRSGVKRLNSIRESLEKSSTQEVWPGAGAEQQK
jgi:CelD/BcsL family acetyltransferase involved in cellulose biosynthesis